MDHDYPEKPCPHGMCHNHSPQWENVEEKQLVPNPLFGLFKRYFVMWCCGQRMQRVIEKTTQRCRKCGRTQVLFGNRLGLCPCCGKTKKEVQIQISH
jgi:hypothetical protein